MDVYQAFFWLILSQAFVSTSTLSWNCGEHSEFVVGIISLSFLFEISMTNSDYFFHLMVAGSPPISWAKLFSIANELNFLLISRSILHLKSVRNDQGFDLEDSSAPTRL